MNNIQFELPLIVSWFTSLFRNCMTFLLHYFNGLMSNWKLKMSLFWFLTLCMGLVNKLYGVYLSETELTDFREVSLIQFGWSKMMGIIYPIFGLLYFLWKLKLNDVLDVSNQDSHNWNFTAHSEEKLFYL